MVAEVSHVWDACVFHEWNSALALTPYMNRGYRELVTQAGDRTGPMNIKGLWLYQNPQGRKASDTYPPRRTTDSVEVATQVRSGPSVMGIPGSDYDLFARQVLDGGRRDRVVLGFDEGLLSTAVPLHYLARAVVSAANDWTVDQWLNRDGRLYGMVLVTTAMPEEAAGEIKRIGRNERMVAIALGTNGLSKPFGHPAYHEIYAAAADLDLPLVIQVGCDAASDLIVAPVAGGPPTTFAEYDALCAQPLAAHISSMIVQGVFEMFPNLRVLLVGGGVTWVPSFLWRLDYQYKTTKTEAPWLRQLPSEYFSQHAKLTTHSLERPRQQERLLDVLNAIPHVGASLLYASCYPNWDFEEPDEAASRVPVQWQDQVFRENAAKFFRWPDRPRVDPSVRAAVEPEKIRDRHAIAEETNDHPIGG